MRYPVRSLGEVGVEVLDCEHATPRDAGVGYAYIAIPNIRDGRVSLDEVRRISAEDFARWTRRARPRAGDVIVTRRGRVGDSAVVPAGLDCAIGQNLVILRSDGSEVVQQYLRWALRSPAYRRQVSKYLNVGAVFDSLNVRDFPRFEIPIPSLADQRAIAGVLDALDDKIELNRRMNETLEALARTKFTSFLQPVSAAIGRFGDIATQSRVGVDPAKAPVSTPYIALEHMPRGRIALSDWGTLDGVVSGKSVFEAGSILFGKLRPYFHKVGVAPVAGACSTDIIVIEPKSPMWFSFALMHASSDAFVAHADATSSGTKMPRASWRDLANYDVALPTEEEARELDVQVRPLIERIVHNVHESRTLSELRDALLPKLISGELRIRDVEATAEAAET